MGAYCFYFVESANPTWQVVEFDCETDEAACERAKELLARDGHRTVEVWTGERRVFPAEQLAAEVSEEFEDEFVGAAAAARG